ncbi:PhzF family phenazine biosynthesis protein [soil metagenome]
MRIVQVDAFTSVRFRGNPAAVCVLEREHDERWMSDVAREMNLSETAFLRRLDDGAWSLRWFTPAVEVDLCGHATLASAHVLWQDGLAGPDETLRFETRSGTLTARRAGDAIVLDFPAEPAAQAAAPRTLLDALGVTDVVATGRNRFDWLVELSSADRVRALAPDMKLLATVDMRGVIVTARADDDDEHDFISRWFGPQSGVDEDPVTGSAHCCLGPWWAERLGRTHLRGYQASARGGTVGVRVVGDRVELTGTAVTVLQGELV